MNDKNNNPLIIYQTEDGTVKIETHFESETIWLSTEQIAELFQRDRTVIVKHIRNIFNEGELTEEVVCAKFAHTITQRMGMRKIGNSDFSTKPMHDELSRFENTR